MFTSGKKYLRELTSTFRLFNVHSRKVKPLSLPTLTQEKESLILDAAQDRFARFGFSKVTMDEIAEDIGMAKASLYYYYPTKEYIFRAVIKREQEVFLQQTAVIVDKPCEAGRKLTDYVRRRIDLGRQLHNLSALNAKLWQNMKPGFRDLFAAFAQEELQLITRILREGKKSGEFSIHAPEKTAEMLLHVLHGLRLRLTQASQFQGDERLDFDGFEKETDLLMETVLHGMKKRNEH
jgi:AcrR family transcriptional regulator